MAPAIQSAVEAAQDLALTDTKSTSLPILPQENPQSELQKPETEEEEKAREEKEFDAAYSKTYTFYEDMPAISPPSIDKSKGLPSIDDRIMQHGWHHGQGKKELAEEEDRCHFCQADKFAIAQKPHRYLIHIINTVDNEWISPEFRFIEKCVLGKGVKESLAPPGYRIGCECKTDADCAKECMCLDDLDPTSIVNPKFKNAYYTEGHRKGLLRYEILELSNDEIYECSDLCSCSANCPNRVVGKGRKFSIEIFKTKDRGFGVRSREDIRKGQFIDRYVGEIITPQEANHRRENANSRKDLYLFAMDKFTNPNHPEEKLREPYEVDGEFMAGPTRFINHSCQPNLRVMAVVTDISNKHLHELCFFALEDIPRHVELTFDYVAGTSTAGDNATVAKEAKERQAQGEFIQKCLCGAKKCRGFLW